MTKRDRILSLLEANRAEDYIPAGFFLHFPPECQRGQAAVDRHLEFFRDTDMDFVKIQYERKFPRRPEIVEPKDWANMPVYGIDFYEEPLEVVDGLVKTVKKEAMVVITLYSAFMCASHSTGRDVLVDHLNKDPESVRQGLEKINESILLFIRACIDRGVDGFYTSTQGGESGLFSDRSIFTEYIKPLDLRTWKEMDSCLFNILHVCDYNGRYDDLTPFVDYPGHVVNCGLELQSGSLRAKEVAEMFDRPFMGGMDRHGVIVSGPEGAIEKAARAAIEDAPDRFILGADCTVPSDISWDHLRTAIDTAHRGRKR